MSQVGTAPGVVRGEAPARNVGPRTSAHRLTIPGLVILLVTIYLGASKASAGVDARIVALALVALAALVGLGVVVPIATIRRVHPVAASGPVDVVEGQPTAMSISLSGRADHVSIRLRDPDSAWYETSSPVSGEIPVVVDTRGVARVARVEIRSSWPLGVYLAGRTHEVTLAHPVHVAPRMTSVATSPGALPAEVTDVLRPSTLVAAGDEVRSVRPYQHGDPPRLVHWPSTARIGALVVRELEPPVRTGLVVVVDLRVAWVSGSDQAASAERVEVAARRAWGLVASALAAGAEVLLSTFDQEQGPNIARVTSVRGAGRRLAGAVNGPPPAGPEGWPVEVVRP